MNPYAAARPAYVESSVLTASPERLVVTLYAGYQEVARLVSELPEAWDRSSNQLAAAAAASGA